MWQLRLIKNLLVILVAAFFTIAAYTNYIDYQTNWILTQHVLSMDTTFRDPSVISRAIENPGIQKFFYCFVIFCETLASLILWIASIRLFLHLKNENYKKAKILVNWGFFIGIFLYFFCFIAIGVEWFLAWQSHQFNPQYSAGLYSALLLLLLIYINQAD